MRRALRTLVSVVLMGVLVVMSACSPKGPEVEKEPFTFDTSVEASVGNLMEDGTAAQLLYATPFYNGGVLRGQNTGALDRERPLKISEIQKNAEVMRLSAVDASNRLSDARDALLKYCETVSQAGLQTEVATEVAARITALEMVQLQTNASANAFSEPFSDSDLMQSYANYMAFSDSVEMTAAVLDEADYIITLSALLIDTARSGSDPTLQQAADLLDQELGAYLEEGGPELQGLQNQLMVADYGLRQLETGDYHFTKAVAGFMAGKGLEIEKQLSEAQPGGELDPETLEFLKQYNSFFSLWGQDLVALATPADPARLIAVEAVDPGVGWWTAYAESSTDYGKAVGAYSAKIPETPQSVKGYLSSGWDTIKTGASEFKKAVGVGVDVVGGVVYEQSRKYFGDKYGNTADEIAQDLKERKRQITDNYKKGRSGSDTFKTAGGYLEGADKAVGDFVGSTVDRAINGAKTAAGHGLEKPGGTTTAGSITNFLAKTTMGMFTDFGKGVYKVMNTTSTQGEMASGMLDIGMSCIGGSKVIFKASALMPGAGKASLTAAKGAANYVERKLTKSSLATLAAGREGFKEGAEISAKEMAVLIEKEALIKETSAALKVLETQKEALKSQFAKILEDGGEFAWMNAKKEVKETLQGAFREQLTKQLLETMKSLKETPTKAMVDYLDFIVGEVSDDVVKEAVEDFVDKVAVPDVALGQWSGRVTVTRSISEGNQGAEENTPVGYSFPVEMTLKNFNQNQGVVEFASRDQDEPETVYTNTGTYQMDGVNFTATFDVQGETTITDSVAFTGVMKGQVLEGTCKISTYRNDRWFYIADGTFRMTLN